MYDDLHIVEIDACRSRGQDDDRCPLPENVSAALAARAFVSYSATSLPAVSPLDACSRSSSTNCTVTPLKAVPLAAGFEQNVVIVVGRLNRRASLGTQQIIQPRGLQQLRIEVFAHERSSADARRC